MRHAAAKLRTVAELLPSPLVLGPSDSAGPLTVFAVFGVPHRVQLVAFADAVEAGVVAKELRHGASVNDLEIHNPTGSRVLLLDGEEVLGAKQNRVFDGSVIVPPGSRVRVPVCCVEEGRWDDRRRHEPFRPAQQVATPRMRADMSVVRSIEGRANQQEVWRSVARTIADLGAASFTCALDDVYRQHEDDLDTMCMELPLHPEQLGTLAYVGDHFLALDWVGSPRAFADLHARLMRGYALSALQETSSARRPARSDAEAVLEHASLTCYHLGPAPGEGQRVAVERDGHIGSGLVLDHELAQLSVLPAA